MSKNTANQALAEALGRVVTEAVEGVESRLNKKIDDVHHSLSNQIAEMGSNLGNEIKRIDEHVNQVVA